ncbi:MAG TPA: Hsp70 family protein [Natronincola sp.]|nr:Hsp70 family protein [Natronincola sp.]
MQKSKQLPIGIDLGTSTSVIAVFRDGKPQPVPDVSSKSKSPVVPSIVALDSKNLLTVGEKARRYADLPGRGVREVKRVMEEPILIPLDNQEYRPEQISSVILKKLAENAAALYGEFTDVVLSVPAIFTDVGKHNTVQAAKLAGLNVIHLISEPTAAALAYGINNLDADEKVLVFDFGGGTLDISIIEMMDGVLDVSGTYGDSQLGGKDFDSALVNLTIEKFKKEEGEDIEITPLAHSQLKEYIELCKKQLSEHNSTKIEIFNFGIKDGIPYDLDMTISREEFNEATIHLVEKAKACLDKALQITNSSADSIQRVLLVGGSTHIPAVQEMLKSIFNCSLSSEVNPEYAVSLGTAIQAARLQNDSDELILVDKYPYGIGVEIMALTGNGLQMVYDPLSKPNSTVPYSVSKEYTLLYTEQERLEIRVFQTMNPNTRSLGETIFTGISATIEDIPHATGGDPHPIIVDFSINTNHLIKLKATISSTGQSLDLKLNPNELRIDDPKELQVAQAQVDGLWSSSASDSQEDLDDLVFLDESMVVKDSQLEEKARLLAQRLDTESQDQVLTIINRIKSARVLGEKEKQTQREDELIQLLMELQ